MALTVEQLRTFDSNWGNLVVEQDAKGTQVKGGGLRHALASLFRMDAAQARNKATYTAIRNAIMQDDRFFAPEVKAKADQLLKGLDNGSGISASTIKGIIRQLDEMSTPEKQREAVKKAAVGHLAAMGVPGNIPASIHAKYTELAADFAAFRSNARSSMASIKVDQRVAEFNRLMYGLFRSVGDDAKAQEIFCATLNKYTPGDGGTVSLNPADKLKGLVDTVKDNLQELDEIGNARGAAVRQSFWATLKRTGALSPGARTELADKGAALPKCGLDFLNGQSDAGAIHRAISKMADAMDKARAEMPRSLMKDLGADEAGACMVKAAMVRLPQEAKRNLLAALETNGGQNLLGYYAQNGANPKAQRMSIVYSSLLAHLRAELGDADAGASVQAPAVDAATLPSEALCDLATDIGDLLVGNAAQKLKNALTKGSGLDQVSDPVAELKGRMNAIAKGSVSATVFIGIDSLRPPKPLPPGQTMRKTSYVERTGSPDFNKINTDFDKDFVREAELQQDYVRVRLDDGTLISPKTPTEVRDALVKFMTGNPDAKFSDVTDDKLKAKAHILMSCMHQAAGADVARAFGIGFDPKGVKAPFLMAGGKDTIQNFTVSKDEKGAITVGYALHFDSPNLVLNIAPYPMGGMVRTEDSATLDASLEVTFQPDALDKLATTDWSTLESSDLRKVEHSTADHAIEKMQENVPEKFRFTCDVNASFSIHADTFSFI